MARILGVGGTGFIGSWVVRQMVAHGHSVRVLHRGRKPQEDLVWGATYILGEAPLSQQEALQAALTDAEPDAVVHMMALDEPDAIAAASAFNGRVGRLVVLYSGDVYRAYGRFTRFEPGPPEPVPLYADLSALRDRLYPYRTETTEPGTLEYHYDKIPVERIIRGALSSSVILRLPKVYGAEGNNELATIYGFANQPRWRWTHGYVENVAAAIVLACVHQSSVGRTYNVGEAVTPTIAERLQYLPPVPDGLPPIPDYDFAQDLVYDTQPIRVELGYVETITYAEGFRRTLRLRTA